MNSPNPKPVGKGLLTQELTPISGSAPAEIQRVLTLTFTVIKPLLPFKAFCRDFKLSETQFASREMR